MKEGHCNQRCEFLSEEVKRGEEFSKGRAVRRNGQAEEMQRSVVPGSQVKSVSMRRE